MQINVFRRKGLSDSHELAVFLQLYGANPWVRKTGKQSYTVMMYMYDKSCTQCLVKQTLK